MDRTVKVLVILFAVAGIALFGYYYINQWHDKDVQKAVTQEKETCLQRIAQMEAEIIKLSEQLETQNLTQPSKSDLADVFGAEKPLESLQPQALDCKQTTAQVVAFFQYLDSKSYLIWPGINMRAEELFDDVFKKMAANPPINVGEMEDLYSLVRNVTHFYRVLGKDRIDLIKEILRSENSVMEPAMAVIFAWLTTCNKDKSAGVQQASLNTLYQYACFFMNTLGGRSYLLRRDSKIRMLVSYYALLVIDMANESKINSYGLDIRPHLDFLFYDLSNQKGLLYRQRYLTHLAALQDKYQ